ncbi:hypothetical protein EDD76_104187 [Kineothrix alysoides]|uniref:Dolichyl-phosphate-mannose-protein mannosyltransferase n=1 Tax=Kineothrix alysoides TaxID=1469948 RepID=A0A4R1R257_9FIRM|nr:hypothetical protein [Kineothrix alysoides]TCL59450.1 hypothetical protein EDD76_104187 [Kineothrix alysoides]
MIEKKWDFNKKKTVRDYAWQLGMLVLLCLQVLLVLYYGGKKAGFHEDEYYSYYSSNRTAGLYEPDREWLDKDTYRNEFVVLEGEGFNYSLVATVQSWDVHPPFFYFLLHTACSLFPGIFSKWLGIGVNLFAYAVNFFLLAWLTYMVTDRNKILTFLVSAAHGFNAVIISGVLFIRMYEWLTLFVLLLACLHVRAMITEHSMRKGDLSFHKFLLPLMFVNYLGFLTQYYYIIFLFFMAAGFCLWLLWRDKNLWNCFRYGLSCAVSIGMAVISYPASLAHIFRGYRGTGAAAEFLDGANTADRFRFFGSLMDEYVFDGHFLLLLALIFVMTIVLFIRKKKNSEVKTFVIEGDYKTYFLLLFAVFGYFFTVSKTALLLYETSNRYELPVYGICMLLTIAAVYTLSGRIFRALFINERLRRAGIAFLFFLFLAQDVHELVTGKVLFLYEEDRDRVEYAKENAHAPVVILYNAATPYHVWWCSDELLEYDGAYFMSEDNQEEITDRIVCGSHKLIVYAADGDTKEESLALILRSNPELEGYRMVGQKSLWSVYEFE